ncbi:MAG: hypothetical protein WD749_02635 [Phycisphaerales bacterium]
MAPSHDPGLVRIRDLLHGIAALLAVGGACQAATHWSAAEQAAIVGCIASLGLQPPGGQGPQYVVTQVSSEIESVDLRHARLHGTAPLDVYIGVVESARPAGVVLSASDTAIHLPPGQLFTLEVRGDTGTQQFSCTSGTSLRDIADGVNAFGFQTGVWANWNLSRVHFQSNSVGAGAFVSVRIIEGYAEGNAAMYGTPTSNPWAPDPATRSDSASDYGSDPVVTMNGHLATNVGLRYSVNVPELRVHVTLDDVWVWGAFRAFQVRRAH